MGKSIRSKRQKALRTIKRKALQPAETLKVTHLNAKLQAYIKRSHELDTLHDPNPHSPTTTTATTAKDEQGPAAIDPILLPAASKGFVHSHPKPRDPADPTVRPYPRGRPRDTGRITFQQAVERERRAMDGVEEEGRQSGAEGGDVEAASAAVAAAQVKVEGAIGGGGEVQEVSMLSDDEDEGNPAEISYVSLGQPARAKRANKHKGKMTTRGGKKLSRSAAVVANWKRLGGGRNGLVS